VPRVTGDHNEGFEVERVVGRTSHPVASRASTPSVLTRGLTHRPNSAFVEVSNRPLRERTRARGDTILLTTHFSGADEAGASDGASPLICVLGGRVGGTRWWNAQRA
jgi:hypothetical protein